MVLNLGCEKFNFSLWSLHRSESLSKDKGLVYGLLQGKRYLLPDELLNILKILLREHIAILGGVLAILCEYERLQLLILCLKHRISLRSKNIRDTCWFMTLDASKCWIKAFNPWILPYLILQICKLDETSEYLRKRSYLLAVKFSPLLAVELFIELLDIDRVYEVDECVPNIALVL